MSTHPFITLTCPAGIHWVWDSGQVIIVDEGTQNTWHLRGFDALAWDYLMLGTSFHDLVTILSALMDLPPQEMETRLADCLRNWQIGGLLQQKEEAVHG